MARRELLLLAPLPLTVAPARSGYEDDGNMKFQDKIFLVRDLYLDRTEIQQCPLTPGSPSTNLGLGAAPTHQSGSLPFNPTTARADR